MRLRWRGALGIALSVALLWWVLRDQDLARLWTVLAASNPWLWLGCTAFATAIFPLRARRWQALLAPTYGRIPFQPLWHATAIGMMINNVVGLRSGEPARAFALTRAQPGVKFPAAFASLAVDRLFDGTVVLLLMLLATLDPAFRSDQMIGDLSLSAYMRPAALLLALILAGALFLLFAPDATARIVDLVVGRVAPRLAPRVHALLAAFVDGLHVLRRPALMAEVLFWTVLHWLCNAFAFWLGFRALGLAAPFTAGLMIQGLIAIVVAAPAAPGFFGLFEWSGSVGLALYGVNKAPAVSWALGFHILSWIPIVVFGAVYLTRMRLHMSDLRAPARSEE